ncbi:hypothetical protein GJ496_006183 [Pomphorhynchus laevis]|nr:hypothetical protein GJ496_006183 [Pomphorhynchus laevis]
MFEPLTDPTKFDSSNELDIHIIPDKDNKQLHIIDTCIGMMKGEMELVNIEHHPNRRFNKRKSRRQNFVHNPDQYLNNISDRHLTEDQKTVLALGLNFNVGQREFARKMLLESNRQTCVKCFDSIENHDDKLKAINYMGESLFNQYRAIKPNKEYKSILPLNLLRALKSLRAMEDVVITPADKDSKVVIWSRESYIEEGLRHLQSDVYVAAVDDDLVIANESVSAILAKGVFENILKINKGRNFDRNDLLNNRNNKPTQRAVCGLPCHPALYDLQRNMLEHTGKQD